MLPPYHHLPPLTGSGRLVVDERELTAWGERFGRAATPPLLVAIGGELGAGKTTLVRAICRGYGVVEEVTSPTYALVHEYDAPRSRVYHLDLYRLKGEEELTNIGWEDIVSVPALVLVEWPDRAGARMPREHVPISLEYADDSDRRVLLAG